jgi:hypothetical protein
MHRVTYWRLLHAAIAAQERSLGLELDWLRTRYPEAAVSDVPW